MRLNLLVLVATRTIVATTLASIGVAALTLLTISGVVLVSATSAVVLLALVKALVGRTLASHPGHELLDDVGDLVCVSGVVRAFFTVYHVALDI